jgi:hypothetical protein
MTPAELVTQWRTEADTLARYSPELARIARTHADELDAAMRALDDDALDLATAARESGYSVERLRHMVADGSVPNAGRKGAPRVRRADLPRKPRAAAGFDAASTAREVLRSL